MFNLIWALKNDYNDAVAKPSIKRQIRHGDMVILSIRGMVICLFVHLK